MGGKNKQRTKGNVRPSSSGRTADLLARESGAVPGFVGFATSAPSELGYVPAVHGVEEIDNLVDADFRMVLRKLSKRDTVTKLKAMQEFGAMCQERESEVVKGVLPYWPRIYCKISMDHDRRVREATQQAFQQLVLKVKRNLAPYLKSIMGHWLIAQCDTYPSAASSACSAFNTAFPPHKQVEALGFCRDEVLTILQDNLLQETPDTLSDPQCVPEEEREAKYLRLVTSSLLALKRLLATLTPQDCSSLGERLAQLIAQAKFWKYSKNKSAQIRGAFFEVVAALCEHTPELIQVEAARACPAVLLAIDDTDPLVLPPLWEAVLHLLSSIPGCWAHVNPRKGLMPKLWALLREGGKGLASALHPNLLPFISKLPPEVTAPDLDFYTAFFSSLILGLSSERAVSSPSESAAIVSAIMECLRFSLLQNAGDDPQRQRIQNMLISDQLLPLVDCALSSPSLQAGPLFSQITDMLVSWEKRAGCLHGDDPAGDEATFHRLLVDFWEGLGRLCARHVDKEEAETGTLEGVASILQVMQCPEGGAPRQGRKKKVRLREKKIRFSNLEAKEKEGVDGPKESQAAEPSVGPEKPGSPLSSGHLEALVCQLAELTMVHVNEHGSEEHLHFLSLLLHALPTPQVFQVLLQPEEGPGREPALRFLLEKVVLWLKQEDRKETVFLVDMVFSVLQCCGSAEEKTSILNLITTMDLKWGIILQIIEKASADPVSLQAYGYWLKGSVLGQRLLELAEELCEAGLKGSGKAPRSSSRQDHSWALISLVLSKQHDNQTLIGEVYVERIIDKLHFTLSKAKGLSDAGNLEPLVSFICDVASTFFSSVRDCLLLASAEELLLSVFQLCAQDQGLTHLSDALLLKLRAACFSGVHSLVHHSESEVTEGTFLHSAALWVKNQLINSPQSVKSLQVLVWAVQSLVETLGSTNQRSALLLSQFICTLTPSPEEYRKMRQALPPQWLKCPVLSGRLRVARDYPCVEVWRSQASLPAHLCACALLGKVVVTALAPGDQRVTAVSSQLPDLKHTVVEILYAIQWCDEMGHSPALVSEYHAMLQDWNLEQRLQEIPVSQNLLDTLYTRSMDEGLLWALTLDRYLHTANTAVQSLFQSPESLFPLTEQRLVTVQVLCPALSTEQKSALVSLCVTELLKWQDDQQDEAQGVTASLAVLHSCLKADCPVEEDILLAVLDTLMEWRNSRENCFLFSSHLEKASAGQLALNVEMMRFLCWVVEKSPTILREPQWDFLLCSMLAWLETASENTASFWNPWVQLFVCQNSELIVTLNQFFLAPPAGVAEQLPSELSREWQEFFVEGIYSLLLPLPMKITELFSEPDDPMFPVAVVQWVGEALTFVPLPQLTQNTLAARLVTGQRSSLPEQLQTLLNTLTPLLLFKARPLQLAVYHVLHKVMPTLPEYDGEGDNTKSDDDDGEEPSLSPPAGLMAILTTTEELLENILGGVQVGEYAAVQPLSVEHCCILGYLLAWKLLLAFFKASPSHLRVQYSLYLKRSRCLQKLLLNLFRLMPENPALPGQEPGSKETKTFFTESVPLSVSQVDGLQWEVPHLACSVYYSALKDLPAMVRLWWNSQEKRVFTTVDKFTSRHVSAVLSAQEITSVHASTQTFHNMTVKARSATREVVATYSVDDIFIELVIQLPQNYPLGAITVESGRRVGVAVQQWRNWMLQLSTYLTHQNGSIMEGLSLWKNNVEKRFEGVEDCMICFSVIHGSNYSLPKKGCRTCKKKFHSACLYKWFTSSNKSTCPLCRETFF